MPTTTQVLTNQVISVTDLRRNITTVLEKAENDPVAIFKNNKAEAYVVSAEQFEAMTERLEDLEDALIVLERRGGSFCDVTLEDL